MSETTLEQEFERWWKEERGDLVFEPSTSICVTDFELFVVFIQTDFFAIN